MLDITGSKGQVATVTEGAQCTASDGRYNHIASDGRKHKSMFCDELVLLLPAGSLLCIHVFAKPF